MYNNNNMEIASLVGTQEVSKNYDCYLCYVCYVYLSSSWFCEYRFFKVKWLRCKKTPTTSLLVTHTFIAKLYSCNRLQTWHKKEREGWYTKIELVNDWNEWCQCVLCSWCERTDRWDDSESNQLHNSLFLNCQMKFPIMKAPSYSKLMEMKMKHLFGPCRVWSWKCCDE